MMSERAYMTCHVCLTRGSNTSVRFRNSRCVAHKAVLSVFYLSLSKFAHTLLFMRQFFAYEHISQVSVQMCACAHVPFFTRVSEL
jgi:hypothetical protein